MTSWNTGLFDCFNDIPTCCYGYFCHPCLYGQVAEKIDGSACIPQCLIYCLLMGCSLCCVVHAGKRQNLRSRYGLQEDCNDWLATCLCAPCAVCQEARELQSRGDAAEGFLPVSSQPRS